MVTVCMYLCISVTEPTMTAHITTMCTSECVCTRVCVHVLVHVCVRVHMCVFMCVILFMYVYCIAGIYYESFNFVKFVISKAFGSINIFSIYLLLWYNNQKLQIFLLRANHVIHKHFFSQ